LSAFGDCERCELGIALQQARTLLRS
jgi:hypothetical protein